MPRRPDEPLISVVIPTRNRARLLRASLQSLTCQTVGRAAVEVVVVDDGSTDDTAQICARAAARLNLRYVRIDPAGIAAAKNAGVFVARAPILFFFDDDDIAAGDLLARHLETHRAHPAEHVAVLGYTTWAPALTRTALMHYVTDVAGYLFCYGPIHHEQWLDFTYFWGGRTSCKRSLLTHHGIFNQMFTFGSEDMELGYRLTRFNLQVLHNRAARQYMNRPVTYDEFCARCERQGRSQRVFSRLHDDPKVHEYCGVIDVERRWAAIAPQLTAAQQRVRELESLLSRPHRDRDDVLQELHGLYRLTFDGCKTKGIVEADGLAQACGTGRSISA